MRQWLVRPRSGILIVHQRRKVSAVRRTLVSSLACIALAVGVPSAGAITGGQPDGQLHPEVGALVGFFPPAGRSIAYCSGTLISPTVFLTAGHCGFLATPEVQVTFDEKYTDDSTVHTGTFRAHPDYKPGTYTSSPNVPDIAVVVFDEPIPGITPAGLPTAGQLDQMQAAKILTSTLFTAVGYGDTQFTSGPGGHTTTHLQARNYSVSTFNSLSAAHLHLSQHQKKDEGGTCNGDSGGPNFIGAGEDETSVIAGITVTGDIYCKATNVDYRLDIPTARDFLDDYVVLP
jgi:secreted trypsin-like serine protease